MVDPELVHVLNHATQLGPGTRAVLLIEMREDGQHTTSRYSKHKSREDLAVCSFIAQRLVLSMFDLNRPPAAPPTLVKAPPPACTCPPQGADSGFYFDEDCPVHGIEASKKPPESQL